MGAGSRGCNAEGDTGLVSCLRTKTGRATRKAGRLGCPAAPAALRAHCPSEHTTSEQRGMLCGARPPGWGGVQLAPARDPHSECARLRLRARVGKRAGPGATRSTWMAVQGCAQRWRSQCERLTSTSRRLGPRPRLAAAPPPWPGRGAPAGLRDPDAAVGAENRFRKKAMLALLPRGGPPPRWWANSASGASSVQTEPLGIDICGCKDWQPTARGGVAARAANRPRFGWSGPLAGVPPRRARPRQWLQLLRPHRPSRLPPLAEAPRPTSRWPCVVGHSTSASSGLGRPA